MARIRLIAPPGYPAVVALEPRRHAGRGVAICQGQAWSAVLNAVPLSTAEMPKAALHYPLAFTRQPRSGELIPVAVLGLRKAQNLFVDPAGQWDPACYLPAFIRRYPFCVTRLPAAADGPDPRTMICVVDSELVDEAPPLFDAQGHPTAAWEPWRKLIDTMEGARPHTRALCRRLEALDLLVPFDALSVPRAGERLRLSGLLRVDESRLGAVDGPGLRAMLEREELRCIYAHLLSLENFGALMRRAAAR